VKSVTASDCRSIAASLDDALAGGVVRAARAVAGEPEACVVEVRVPGASHWVFVAATGGNARIHRVEKAPPQPVTPPPFVMLLRKYLVGVRVSEVRAQQDERVVEIVCAVPATASGDASPPLLLVAELTDPHANILLCLGDRVLGALTRRGVGGRDLRPGREWVPLAPASRGESEDLTAARRVEADVRLRTTPEASDDPLARRRAAASVALGRLIGKLDRTMKKVAQDAARVDRVPALRREAELLRSAWGRVAPGASSVVVPDYYREGAPETTIPLDPRRSLEANIESRFARAKRYERGYEMATSRLEELAAERRRLEALAESLADADAGALEQLFDTTLRGPERRGQRDRNAGEPRKPYTEFRSSDGWTILVGRGAKDNDTLTFRVARGNDVWMHAADWPGSHVVVRVPRGASLPPRTLLEAAQLAAHYSKGRADTLVAVTWTERKHVRKPAGAPPGRVSVAGGRTIEVRPDPAVIAALSASRI
jgi:predicted ribosome quality control (RQC) complex YloA/Tae2 family protein